MNRRLVSIKRNLKVRDGSNTVLNHDLAVNCPGLESNRDWNKAGAIKCLIAYGVRCVNKAHCCS